MTEFVTWGEFKRRIEKAGVRDDDIVAKIDIQGNMNFDVGRDVRDKSITVASS